MLQVWLKMSDEMKATMPKAAPSPRLRGAGGKSTQEPRQSNFFHFPSPSCESVTPSKVNAPNSRVALAPPCFGSGFDVLPPRRTRV